MNDIQIQIEGQLHIAESPKYLAISQNLADQIENDHGLQIVLLERNDCVGVYGSDSFMAFDLRVRPPDGWGNGTSKPGDLWMDGLPSEKSFS